MLEKLKRQVYEANLNLVDYGLVVLTWGNASGYDPDKKLVVIKPSGVNYSTLKIDDMVVVDLTGRIVEGNLKPSSDTPTHLAVYREHPDICGIVHTHSTYATAFAQARRPIPVLGTTHADSFYNAIPVTRALTKKEVEEAYEYYTGSVINEVFVDEKVEDTPAVLVAGHGPFTFGKSPFEAAKNALILEQVAKMAHLTLAIDQRVEPLEDYVKAKHYNRKHGRNSYYGQ